MKLHLGGFKKEFHGCINVDIRPEMEPDLLDDVFRLEKVENGSVELIYCCHVLEHATRTEAINALTRWLQVLAAEWELGIICA